MFPIAFTRIFRNRLTHIRLLLQRGHVAEAS